MATGYEYLERFKRVDASRGPLTTNGALTFDYVSLKNVVKAWIVVQLTQAVGHATIIQPKKATLVDGTGVTNVVAVQRIRANEDTAASDTEAVQTSAASYTVAADIKKKLIVIEIDPVSLGETFDVLGCTTSASSQVTNFASAHYVLQMKHQGATTSAVITD